MSIKKTLTDEYTFWNWQQDSDSYKDGFSLEACKALFNYFDELSEETKEDIEFDPIAWLGEFNEFDSIEQAWAEYGDVTDDHKGKLDLEATLEWFRDETEVIELENGHYLIGTF